MSYTEKELHDEAERIVRNNVFVCLSSLVYTLAQGRGDNSGDVAELCEQAAELFSPLLDYQEAAAWHIKNEMDASELQEACEKLDVTAVSAGSADDFAKAMQEALIDHLEHDDDAAREFCEDNRVEPYEREIFEHWAIDSGLASRLEAQGERVDRDFAGMIVWGRTCTGQGISSDENIRDMARANFAQRAQWARESEERSKGAPQA